MPSKDMKILPSTEEHRACNSHPMIGKILKFFGWWFGFSGLYAMFAVCPFCGQAGCPVGAGSTGFVGGIFTLFLHIKNFLRRK